MARPIINEKQLNSPEVNGDYWLEDHSKLEPLLVQSIINKYNELKFIHLLKGDIIREDYTGEVRMIVRKYTKASYVPSSKIDIIISSSGWRVDQSLLDMVREKLGNNPDFEDLFRGN